MLQHSVSAGRTPDTPEASDWVRSSRPNRFAAEGAFVVRGRTYLSIYPAMRTWMKRGPQLRAPVEIGD